MSDMGSRKPPQDQSSGSGQSVTLRQPNVADPISSKRVCFYKSGDPKFNGLRMVINNRTFKTFDALLDSLSKKVPLPFGVRNITTPRGVNAVHTLDDLEDGKSYICSDSRKVKPINLALASRKPPPWYHARPITPARRRTYQPVRSDPGWPRRKRKQKQRPMVVRTPKRLTVYRNGDPGVKHTVILQKKTTPTFESLLDYVSRLMQFPVVKLHTPNGGRVDGLPALILCAGRVVAAGREPFKYANYNTQKPTATNPWLPASRMPSKRKKPAPRKKKSPVSSSTKSRNFSVSSERYFVNQIQNSMAGSFCDYPSNPTGSVELVNGHRLESVAETDGDDTCLEDGGDGRASCLPMEDDIEKSFRVNQDGSMTVEMKVRLTIKEEETVHWTTTVTRSGVANQLSSAESEAECVSLQPQDPPPIDTVDGSRSKDGYDLFRPGDGVACEEGMEEKDGKVQRVVTLPRRTPTPGSRILTQQQASVESITTVTGEEIQQNMAGSYSYREETEHGKMTEEYRMVRQSSARPVPKPRRVGSTEINNYNQSTFKSNGISQTEDSAEEITETVLHIYEQQTCQDSYHANSEFSTQGASMYGSHNGRQPTEMRRPSTASESISAWRTDDRSVLCDPTVPTLKTGKASLLSQKHTVINTQEKVLTKPKEDKESLMSGSGKEQSSPKETPKAERTSSKPKVKKISPRTTPEKRQTKSNADVPEKRKKVKTGFSSAASIRKIYGFRPKTVKNLIRKKRQGSENRSVQINSEPPVTHIKFNLQNPNQISTVKEQNVESKSETHFKKNVSGDSSSADAQERGTLAAHTSVHEDRTDRETQNMSECVPLPALNSSPNVINEYVEHWLEKAHASPTLYPEEETQNVETNPQVGLKGWIPEVSETTGAEEKSKGPSVITSAPNGSHINGAALVERPSLEKTPTESKHILHHNGSMENTTICNGLSTEKPPRITTTSLDEAPSPTDGKTKPYNQSPLRETPSRNSSVKKTKLVSNTSLEMKMSERKASVEKSAITSDPLLKNTSTSTPAEVAVENIPLSSSLSSSPTLEKSQLPRNRSLNTTALHNNASVNTTTLPTSPRTKKTTAPSSLSSEKIPAPRDNLLLKRLSPYSQSLELVSPPTTVKLKKKSLTTNHSLDNTADEKTPLPRKNLSTELTLSPLTRTVQGGRMMVKEELSTITQTTIAKSLQASTQPDIKSVLEKLCHSIQSIRCITQNKLTSCLERSNRLPDFSSHVASTFGSPSKTLLAFLSVMTLKEGIANLNMQKLNANSVSCAEALKMMESLREIARIEDADRLQASLTALQRSASTQLLQSWKGFQELSDDSKSHSSTLNSSAHNLLLEPCPKIESYQEENNIDELINELDMPEKLKEELVALPAIVRKESKSIEVIKVAADEIIDANSTSVLEEEAPKVNESVGNVKSIIKHFMNIQQAIESNTSPIVDSSHSQQKQLFSENQCLGGDNVCLGVSQSSKEEGYEHMEDCLGEEAQHTNSLAAHDSCVDSQDLPPGHKVEDSTHLEKEHTSHTGDRPSYIEPEAKCIELLVSSTEKNMSSPEEDMISRHEEGRSEENREALMEDQLCLEMHGQEMKCTELEVSSKDRERTPEMVKDSIKEFHADDLASRDVQIYEEQTKESHPVDREKPSSLVEQSIPTGNETICLGKQYSTLEEHHSLDVHEDSENEDVSCKEHTDATGVANDEDKQCTLNEQSSCEEKESSSKEHINIEESYSECQESYVEEQLSEEETNDETEVSEEKIKCQTNEIKTTFHSEETPAQSVAERVTLLEKKVAGLDQKRTVIVETPGIKRRAEIEVPIASDGDDLTNVSPLSNDQAQIDDFATETPTPSLAFSYDSNSSSPRDHEGNRVKSLKEMFMAKSAADIQYGHRRAPSPNASDLSDSRPQTSDSGGRPSRTSPEWSSDEESRLKSIAKGIVKRTIERLYGKKDDHHVKDSSDVEKPRSPPKAKLKEGGVKSILSPFHTTPTKAMSELSYFNATNSVEAHREPTRCIAFNTQVAPGDSVDEGRWLFRENTAIRKSISEPSTINKGTETRSKTETERRGDAEEDVPYSHFSRTPPKRTPSSELEDEGKPVAPKCAYFTLPHGRDPDMYQDEMSTASKIAVEADLTQEKQDKTEEEPKSWIGKHVPLPDFTPTDFKKLDNKVHPLTEGPTEGQVVVAQPEKGQKALKGPTAVNVRSQDPDVIEMLYVFCGQHCPIL